MSEVRNRPSRTLDLKNAPQKFFWLEIEGEDRLAYRELISALKSPSIPAKERLDTLAWVNATLLRIEGCLAIDPEDVRPISQHPNLWEVRIWLKKYEMLLRIYFAEIPKFPSNLLAIHAHEKLILDSDKETAAAQDEEIAIAIKRFDLARAAGFPGREYDLTS